MEHLLLPIPARLSVLGRSLRAGKDTDAPGPTPSTGGGDMQLSPEQRFAKLARWTNPPSEAELERLERARRMVTRAVQQHPQFAGLGLSVKAKGSWANNTNVSRDSDVDI